MRLLRVDDNGEFSLVEYVGRNTPPYAILSHTWGDKEEEVTFQDMTEGKGKDKPGYSKIRFCTEQAARDGLQYSWIDTCCIDKTGSAEISEAIISMFHWYQNAAKCYVYLSDVSTNHEPTIKRAFLTSRWFSRGWTLQELLAPKAVEFYSREGNRIGSRISLEQEIHDRTGIPVEALRGSPLSQFSVPERMSWAENRHTTREEDVAYSLLGIFDIQMLPLYGEGRENALNRLRSQIPEAEHSSQTPSLYEDFKVDADSMYDGEKHGDIPTDIHHTPITYESRADTDEIRDTHSDAGTDIASVFSDGGMSASSASTASMNPVQTTGIREVSRALLSQDNLKALYTTAVRNVERRKARTHIRGFLKEYGRNLLKEASNRGLETQAAKFVQELAGRIADEISWSITGFEEVSRPRETSLAKKDLESWLSSLQPQSVDAEEINQSGPAGTVEEMFEDGHSDEEPDDGLIFPNIDKVNDFLLDSEAFRAHVASMQTWLKVGQGRDRDAGKHVPGRTENPENRAGSSLDQTDGKEKAEVTPTGLAAPEEAQQNTEHIRRPSTEVQPDPPREEAQEPTPPFRQNRSSVSDLVSGLLNFWGISFFFYDIVELFVPRIPPGYKRLRWRCVSFGVPRYFLKSPLLLIAPSLATPFFGETLLTTAMVPWTS